MISVTNFFTVALNLVQILVIVLDKFVRDSYGNSIITQTSYELLDFEIFLLFVYCKLMVMMILLLGPLGVGKSTLLLVLVDKLDSDLEVK
jgi:putative ribosome biogenesis GTPase RsgA